MDKVNLNIDFVTPTKLNSKVPTIGNEYLITGIKSIEKVGYKTQIVFKTLQKQCILETGEPLDTLEPGVTYHEIIHVLSPEYLEQKKKEFEKNGLQVDYNILKLTKAELLEAHKLICKYYDYSRANTSKEFNKIIDESRSTTGVIFKE